MGDLANALRDTGQHDEALEVAEKCVLIQQALGNQREVAADHGRCARILVAAGRYDEADARYDLALAAARQAGDKGLEGTALQHQGRLASQRNQLDRATRLYQQALQRFQEAGATRGVMRTYNLLGVSEQKAGRLAEARAWYGKSRELAVQLKDQPGLGHAAQNIGIVCQGGRRSRPRARRRGRRPAALRGSPPLRGGKPADQAGARQQARGSRIAPANSPASTSSSATSPPPSATPTPPARSTNPSA